MAALVRVLTAVIAVLGTLSAALWASVTAAFTPLAVVTALVMGGTGNSLSYIGPAANTPAEVVDYQQSMGQYYIEPAFGPIDHYVPVDTPEQFWPVKGTMTFNASVAAGVDNLMSCLAGNPGCSSTGDYPMPGDTTGHVVFGYSQSARIATIAKRGLIDSYQQSGWVGAPDVSFVVIGNPNRPNGGFLQRFTPVTIPILDVTADGATPTDSGCDDAGLNCHLNTVDISRQYDGWSDFPSHPGNLLAVLNAFFGIFFAHGSYDVALDEENLASGAIVSQGSYQDTRYYMIPAKTIPLLAPLSWLLPAPIVTALDAPLRAIIEMGYDRAAGPGAPIRAHLSHFSPIRDLITVGVAVATGIDDALAQLTGNPRFRPLGTRHAGMFGVRGSALSDPRLTDLSIQVDEPGPPQIVSATPEVVRTAGADSDGRAEVTGDGIHPRERVAVAAADPPVGKDLQATIRERKGEGPGEEANLGIASTDNEFEQPGADDPTVDVKGDPGGDTAGELPGVEGDRGVPAAEEAGADDGAGEFSAAAAADDGETPGIRAGADGSPEQGVAQAGDSVVGDPGRA